MAGQGGPRDFEGIIRFSGGSEGIGRNRQSIRGGGLWNIECQRGANIRISQSLRRDQVNFIVTLTQPVSPTPPGR